MSHWWKQSRTPVGRQHIKITVLQDGIVKDFKLNTQRLVGNGYFLQAAALQHEAPAQPGHVRHSRHVQEDIFGKNGRAMPARISSGLQPRRWKFTMSNCRNCAAVAELRHSLGLKRRIGKVLYRDPERFRWNPAKPRGRKSRIGLYQGALSWRWLSGSKDPSELPRGRSDRCGARCTAT
jgi:hypothetical protein